MFLTKLGISTNISCFSFRHFDPNLNIYSNVDGVKVVTALSVVDRCCRFDCTDPSFAKRSSLHFQSVIEHLMQGCTLTLFQTAFMPPSRALSTTGEKIN